MSGPGHRRSGRVADVCRQTVFIYRDKVDYEGVAGLLKRGLAPGNRSLVRGAVRMEFVKRMGVGQFRQDKEA